MIRRYYDLDGVFADFDRHFFELFGEKTGMSDARMWQLINDHGTFFIDLPPCPEALDFFNETKHLDPIILTACPKTNYVKSARQKIAWVRKWLSDDIQVLPVLGGVNKTLFMHKTGDLLIDDHKANCDSWTQNGGVAILHRSFTLTREQFI